MFSQLTNDPAGFLINLLYTIPGVLLALTLHEVSHGYTAYRCGDDTAMKLGRLSLNPLRHLDPIGAVCLLLFRVGWARPVPVNPRNYRHYRRDDLLVSSAGILMNLCLYILATVLCVLCVRLMIPAAQQGQKVFFNDHRYGIIDHDLIRYAVITDRYNTYLYEMIGQGVLSNTFLRYLYHFLYRFAGLNLSLALFNLLPVPPLDGFHIFNDIIFRGRLRISPQVFRFGMAALLIVSFATNWISTALTFMIDLVDGGLMSVLLPLFGL
ncbi:MAG: site-2 protease family protein [Clostridia bacterium]|nr:site-2 protease family protein [Clostridia bacterium]